MTDARLIDDPQALEDLRPGWDRLAEERGLPFSLSAWMLAWWRHVAPPTAELRAAIVADGDELIGIAPFFVDVAEHRRARYRLLGAGTSLRAEPLAAAGRDREVAAAVGELLRGATPMPNRVELEGIAGGSAWPELLARGWGAPSPATVGHWEIPAPVLPLAGRTYDEWFAAKSSNFREQMRRGRRKLDKQGALFRMSGAGDEFESDLRAFGRLHHARWEDRGGSATLDAGVAAMLADAGLELAAGGRMRLWCIELEGAVISAHLFLAAGGEVAYWLGGFDDRWASFRPALLTILAAIEHAFDAGDRRVDLGGGGQDYKYRFAEAEETLRWWSVVPRGPGYWSTRLELAPARLRRKLMGRLSPELRARLKRIARR